MEAFSVAEIPADTETERYCPECEQMKPFDSFYRDGHTADGAVKYRRDCKECYKAKRMVNKRLKRKAMVAKAAAAKAAARKKGRRK